MSRVQCDGAHRNKDNCKNTSERNIECVVQKELMTQTKQRVIMRILYYQCVNGVSFLSGY